MRSTSLKAYRNAKASGLVSRQALIVYRVLLMIGRATTATEIGRRARVEGLWRRLSELQRQGLVSPVCERRCRITGRQALGWIAHKRLPAESAKRFERKKFWLVIASSGRSAIVCKHEGAARAMAEKYPGWKVIEVQTTKAFRREANDIF